jgi:hypothetical protein
MPHPGCFTPGEKTWYPFYRRLGRPGPGLDGNGKS